MTPLRPRSAACTAGPTRPVRGPLHPVATATTTAATVAAVCALLLGSGARAAAPAPVDDPLHTLRVQRGDTVIGLSRLWLEEPQRWRELVRPNGLRDPNRIYPGQTLKVPLRLMRTAPAPATVVSVTGGAAGPGGQAVQAGQQLPEGSAVQTGDDGHVTLRLVDGSLLRLRPGSQLQLDLSRQVPGTEATRAGVALPAGRVEVEAARAAAGRPGFRVRTPQGVLGVRGTEFRVATDADEGRTRGEVLGGTVAFSGRADGAGSAPETPVTAGQGSVIGAQGEVSAPAALLPAPDASGWPARHEVPTVQLPLPDWPEAVAWRAQVAVDPQFDDVRIDLRQPAAPQLRLAGLPDGRWFLRVRGIDAQGLEGLDQRYAFELKARPEPPLPASPAPRAVLFGDSVELAWARNDDSASDRLQVARDPAFASLVRDEPALRRQEVTLDGLSPGVYHWRLGSTRADGDRGPWGVARSFELRPLPPGPQPPRVGDHALSFSWDGEAGQQWDFEMARDAAFAAPLVQQRLTSPTIDVPRPAGGRYYLRLRTHEADGFVGPWSRPHTIDLPNCVRDGSGACVRSGDGTLNLAD